MTLLLTSCASEPETSSPTSPSITEGNVAEVSTPAPFNIGAFLGGNVQPTFPAGEAGVVSVVHTGPVIKPGMGASMPFAFRNNTAAAISHVDWVSTARSGGSIISTGSSQGTVPAQVQAGEIGFAYIYFANGEVIPEDTEYSFEVQTLPADTSPFNTAALKVTESAISGDAIVGSATNETGAEISGPYSVDVYCFDGERISAQFRDYAEQDANISAGAAVSFNASLYGENCSKFVVGVGGYFAS